MTAEEKLARIREILTDPGLPHGSRVTGALLVLDADEAGESEMSYRELQRVAGLSPKTVADAVFLLCHAGLMDCIHRYQYWVLPDGSELRRNYRNVYRFTMGRTSLTNTKHILTPLERAAVDNLRSYALPFPAASRVLH